MVKVLFRSSPLFLSVKLHTGGHNATVGYEAIELS